MLDQLISEYHLHPIVDHFTIALLAFGVAAEFLAAAATLGLRGGTGWLSPWSQKLRTTALVLITGGASAAILSYYTGDIEADRLWDSMSPAAQQILSSTDASGQYLSHAVLGQYLMYAFLILALWRVWIELSPRVARWRIAFLITAGVAVGALLYQGKTGGELVYEHGVGISRASGTSQHDAGLAAVGSDQDKRHEALAAPAPRERLPSHSVKR